MSAGEITRKVLQLGFELHDDSTAGNYVFRKDGIEFLGFQIHPENSLRSKNLQFQWVADTEQGIDRILEKYRKRYLEMVGIIFEEEKGGIYTEQHGGIIFSNDRYEGSVRVSKDIVREGEYTISYSLAKID